MAIDCKSVERLAYGYELMHRAICNLAGTSGADPRWYMEVAQNVQHRVSPIFKVGPDSNPHKPGDCLSYYKEFLDNVPEPAAQPLYDRMLALVEGLAANNRRCFTDEITEARAIMAELRPVDPDLIEAREIAAETLTRLGASAEQIAAGEIGNGEKDDAIVVHAVLAALKRGRELAVQS